MTLKNLMVKYIYAHQDMKVRNKVDSKFAVLCIYICAVEGN